MKYDRIVPADSFIGQYLAHMAEQETSHDYDFWCAIWLMSCAVGRNVIVDRPRAPVYMNPYIILVANSGVTRKSSAVGASRKLAQQLLEDDPHIGLIESKTTPEKLDAILADRTRVTGNAGLAICISELAVFLGTERYNAAMPAALTDLYDCAASRGGGGTISAGARDQRNLFVNFLSASTPAWLHRAVNPNVVEGGFTSRCIFVVSEQPKRRIAWATERSRGTANDHTDDHSSTADLLCRLREFRTQGRNYGTITINTAALNTFRSWYARRTYNLDPFRSSFESREDAHILRLAAFLCINDGSWVIQQSHLKHAIRIIAEVKLAASRLFEGAGSSTNYILGYERLREALLKAGAEPLPRSHLFLKVRTYLDNHEFSAMLDVMHEAGMIQRFTKPHDGAGRPPDLIRGTKLLLAKDHATTVLKAIES